ncbi:hypothetical protein CerSpe_149050 [Prunus speciosa]
MASSSSVMTPFPRIIINDTAFSFPCAESLCNTARSYELIIINLKTKTCGSSLDILRKRTYLCSLACLILYVQLFSAQNIAFQDLGASSLQSGHDLLRTSILRPEIRTGAAQVEGGVHGLVSYEKKSF